MDKSLVIFIAVGLGALYLIINFVSDIQKEDDTYRNNDYNIAHQYDKYERTDSIGQSILVFEAEDIKTQLAVWHSSKIKQEFLAIFPDYSDMKTFVKERIRSELLQKTLIKKIDEVEGKFFSGTIDSEQAKQMLDSLK